MGVKFGDASASSALVKRKLKTVRADVSWNSYRVHIKIDTSRKVMYRSRETDLKKLLSEMLSHTQAKKIKVATYMRHEKQILKILETIDTTRDFMGYHFIGPRGINSYQGWVSVTIDIKPGSYPNSIKFKSEGQVPVAILTTDDFYAYDVDPVSCKFAGADPLHWNTEDVDYDGDDDMTFYFKTQELDLDQNSTEASLECETYDGIQIIGTDSVNIVPKYKWHGKIYKWHSKKSKWYGKKHKKSK